MEKFDPQAYGPAFAPLLATDRRRPLGAGSPNAAACGALDQLSTESAFAHLRSEFGKKQPVDAEMAACCVSGVWLLDQQQHSLWLWWRHLQSRQPKPI